MNTLIAERTGPVSGHLITETEAAKILGLSPRTLETWRLSPDRAPGGRPLAYVRFGSARRAAVRYRPADVEAWISFHLVA